MKVFLTIGIILFCIFFIGAIWNNNKKNCFELKIVYKFTSDDNVPKYCIEFTNNGWHSSKCIEKTEDFTKTFDWLSVHNMYYVGSKEKATEFAKQFNSYEECIAHNKKEKEEYERLVRLYNEQGIPTLEEKQKSERKYVPEIEEVVIKSCK